VDNPRFARGRFVFAVEETVDAWGIRRADIHVFHRMHRLHIPSTAALHKQWIKPVLFFVKKRTKRNRQWKIVKKKAAHAVCPATAVSFAYFSLQRKVGGPI
jgi:hypothetical protein